MKTYLVKYRGEFEGTVRTDSAKRALKKFQDGEIAILPSCELHRSFFEVQIMETGELLKEEGSELKEEAEGT